MLLPAAAAASLVFCSFAKVFILFALPEEIRPGLLRSTKSRKLLIYITNIFHFDCLIPPASNAENALLENIA
jgi:hypothetical protein